MQREEAYKLLTEHLTTPNLINHSLAVEAVMRRLAKHLGEDEEKWGLAGLLHDIDYDYTKDDPQRHSMEGADLLTEKGLPEDLVYAVRVHNDAHGLPLKSRFDKALYAADPITGFIVASALVKPDKKLESVNLKSLKKKFKDKAFAKGASREQMKNCEDLGLTLPEFLELGLEAMQGIAEEMGM